MAPSLAASGETTIPFIERIFADGAYAGRKMAMTVWRTVWNLQIVKRSYAAGFEVLQTVDRRTNVRVDQS